MNIGSADNAIEKSLIVEQIDRLVSLVEKQQKVLDLLTRRVALMERKYEHLDESRNR